MGQILDFMFKLDVAMTNGFPGQVSKAVQELQRMQSQTQNLQKASGNINAYKKQQDAITSSASKLNALREKLSAQQRLLHDSKRTLGSISAEYKRAQKNLSLTEKTEGKDSAKFLQAQAQVQKLAGEFKKAKASVKDFERGESELSQKVKAAEESLSGQKQKLSDMEQGLKSAGIDTRNLASEQQRLAGVIQRSQDAMTRYASLRQKISWGNIKSEFMKAYAALKPFEAPVKLSMDFEAAMARVQAAGFTDGKNLEGLERMKEQALELGAATKFTAVEAARAQENLIRAGMTPEQTMSAMAGTLNMAAAEGMSIDEASAIIAKGLGGMGLEAKLAPSYADVLAYTSSKSNTDIRTIAEAMRIAAPTAAGQNIQLEQLASYIGALANKGFEGTTVGLAISSSISRLARRPKMADSALRELGVSVMTKSGGLVELPHIMEQLDEKMKGMGELQKQGYMSRIFGGDYDKIMLAFMSAVTNGEQEKLQAGEYTESFGWSKKQADINLDTLAGQMDILQSSWDGLRTTIGDIFSPVVRKGVEKLSSGLSYVNKLIKDNYKIAKPLIMLLGAGIVGKSLGGIASIASEIIQLPFAKIALWNAQKATLAAIPGNLGALGAGANGLANGMTAAASGAKLFGMSLSTALTWLPLIVYASYEIYQNWEKITQWAENAGKAIMSIDTSKISAAKSAALPRSDPDYGLAVMTSTYAPPEIKAHAKGGILTQPHLGLVAEAGPEAVIPLRDKTRGISVLTQAADLLGVDTQPQIFTMTRSDSHDRRSDDHSFNVNHFGGNRELFAPVINLTVNSGGNNEANIAGRIKQAVTEALEEIYSRQERLSYAV